MVAASTRANLGENRTVRVLIVALVFAAFATGYLVFLLIRPVSTDKNISDKTAKPSIRLNLAHPDQTIAGAVAIAGLGCAFLCVVQILPYQRRLARELSQQIRERERALETMKKEREIQEAKLREKQTPWEQRNNDLQQKYDALLRDQRPIDLVYKGLERINDVVMLTEAEANRPARIVKVNPAFEKMTGYTEREILLQSPKILQGPKTDRDTLDFLRRRMTEMRANRSAHDSVRVELLNYRKEGHPEGREFWVELSISLILDANGQITHWMSVQRDITQRKLAEVQQQKAAEQSQWEATHDVLTGLFNRGGYQEKLKEEIAEAQTTGYPLAVLFLDIDNFKNINDTLGHITGDELLQLVAKRLRGNLREEDSIARMGGDEFTLLLPNLKDVRHAELVAQKLLDKLRVHFMVDGHKRFITASIGISIAPRDGNDVDTLLKNADTALYHAKDEGRDTYRVFDHAMMEENVKLLEMEVHLNTALRNNEFSLLYQPQVDLESGKVFGVEALLRWNNPILGRVSPADFIPMVEKTRLIIDIGKWVLEEACRVAAKWQREGRPLRMSVNLSVRQLKQGDLPQTVQRVLRETGLDPCWLDLELTEGMLMGNSLISDVLHELEQLGVRLSVDDFGTGYSNLQYLRTLPIHVLKIDRAFVTPLGNDADERSEAIPYGIISMGHRLGFEIIAEGVETEAQRGHLCKMRCNAMQGYLFSAPTSAEQVEALIEAAERKMIASSSGIRETMTVSHGNGFVSSSAVP